MPRFHFHIVVAPADDVRTIMLNQVSWGAVFAGATIALVMQIILNMVGVGVGLSTVDVAAGDTPSAGSLSVGAGIWWVISGIVAAAVGGYIAGRLSGKASQSTAALSRFDCVGGFDPNRRLPALVGCLGSDWRRREHGIVGAWRSRQSLGRVRSNCGPYRSRLL
jgi:hypothetical protein